MSKLKIGIQGGAGSFNEGAILHYLNINRIDSYDIRYLYTTKNVLKSLHEGVVDLGLFAIYNSIGGIVQESVEALEECGRDGMNFESFKVMTRLSIPIRHFLMKLPSLRLEELTTIMAHPQVFLQCHATLATRYPYLTKESGEGDLIDTAQVAKALSEGRISKYTAILGPGRLVELYGFEIIDRDLQDDHSNKTTFLLLRGAFNETAAALEKTIGN
jgi:prephenate dehydratase